MFDAVRSFPENSYLASMSRPSLRHRGFSFLAFLLALGCTGSATTLSAATVEYNLTIAEKDVNFTGKPRTALAVNGTIPAPTLTCHEGDLAVIHVTNARKEEASVHCHGLLCPNRMDGVRFVTYPPYTPAQSFVSLFPVRHHGPPW